MHSPDETCFAEVLLDRLMPALMRADVISADAMLELAEELDREAETASIREERELGRMALALRMWAIKSVGRTRSEWQADQQRKRFRVVELKGEE